MQELRKEVVAENEYLKFSLSIITKSLLNVRAYFPTVRNCNLDESYGKYDKQSNDVGFDSTKLYSLL